MSGYCRDCGNTLCICKLINSNVSAEEHHKTYEELYFESLKVIGMAKQENEKLRKCVEFYADKDSWDKDIDSYGVFTNENMSEAYDMGKKARQTLKDLNTTNSKG